jgi:uncharacterized protein (TIGR02452 family)
MNKSSRKESNKKIYADTLEYVDELSLSSKLSPTIKLKIKNEEIIFNYKKKYNKTIIQVINQDVIKTTIDLYNTNNNQKKNILVLNLASKKHFGGGVKNGAMAQEEELFRKTSYGKHFGAELYPLNLNEFTFTPEVYIIKDESYNRIDVDKIFSVDMLAISALANPILVNDKLNEPDYNLTFYKIETIFKYAQTNGNEHLVLGALGCGAFNNPPLDIIEMFNVCLKKYNGYFANIIFSVKSIFDDNFNLFNEHIVR